MLRIRELTARAPGAVAILELRGAGALDVVAALTGRARPTPGAVFLARLAIAADDGPGGAAEDLDEALVLALAPELAELHLHGSPPLVEQVLGILRERFGAVDAPPGSGLEERARAAVAHAPSEAGARLLLDQAQGALRAELERLSGLAEPELDRGLGALLERGERARRVLRPTVVALVGPVNAGKSTLFNLLVGEERALTSELEGTTRDLLRARAQLGPWPLEWVDTAGARALGPEADASAGEVAVERAGQALAEEAARGAELVLELRRDAAGPRQVAGDARPRVVLASRAGRAELHGEPPRIAALEDPTGTLEVVRGCVERALGLREPAWEAGVAVPFAEDQLRALRGVADAPRGTRAAALRAWLDSV